MTPHNQEVHHHCRHLLKEDCHCLVVEDHLHHPQMAQSRRSENEGSTCDDSESSSKEISAPLGLESAGESRDWVDQ